MAKNVVRDIGRTTYRVVEGIFAQGLFSQT